MDLGWDVGSGGDMCVLWPEGYGNSMYFVLNLAVYLNYSKNTDYLEGKIFNR